MARNPLYLIVDCFKILLPLLAAATAVADDNWPQFRGPDGNGHAKARKLPVTWSETNNIVWKVPVHDEGWSSPVIYGKQIWLTTARPDGKELFALCFDIDTGKVIHDVKLFDVEKPDKITQANTYASPTPLIEKGRVFVNFGTYGTAALDTGTGKVIWSRRDINCNHHMGPGSSLASFENLLVFHVDGMDQQYVIALDKATGATAWKTPRSVDYSGIRPEWRKAFSTPAVARVAGRTQLVSVGSHATMGYDASTGEELWKVRYVGWSAATRPVCGDGMVYMINDYDHPKLFAIRLDGKGDVTGTHIAWSITNRVSSTPSPLLVDDLLYFINDQGFLFCVEAKTGQAVWEQKIGGIFGTSPLYAADRIYLFSRAGSGTVLKPGRKPEVLSTNQLDGTFMASPAVADNSIFLRSKTHLYRISKTGR